MSNTHPAVLYLHGFNSSPASRKAQQFKLFCETHASVRVLVPALPPHPADALSLLRDLMLRERPVLLVGSSLGGFYATVLCEEERRNGQQEAQQEAQYKESSVRAALVNPAVAPCEHLGEEFLGPQRNLYTGEEWEFTQADVEALRSMTPARIHDPQRYLLLVQTGDEVLDYRLAVAFYRGCTQVVKTGGSHAFDDFAAVLPQIVAFAGLQHASV